MAKRRPSSIAIGVDQGHHHLDVVAGHDHLGALRQLARAGHVGGTEVELGTVTLEERGMTTALFLGQHVHLSLELGVRGDGTGLGQDLATLHFLTLGATQEHAQVVAGLALVQRACGTSRRR